VLPRQGARSAPFSHTSGLFWGLCRLNVRSCDSLLCALYVLYMYCRERCRSQKKKTGQLALCSICALYVLYMVFTPGLLCFFVCSYLAPHSPRAPNQLGLGIANYA
jgi:hypothetical protein